MPGSILHASRFTEDKPVSWDSSLWDGGASTAQKVRDLTGLTTDEVSDAIMAQFVVDGWEKVKDYTGRETWNQGDPVYPSAEQAAVWYAAQFAFERAGMMEKMKEAEAEATRRTQGLMSRVPSQVWTR